MRVDRTEVGAFVADEPDCAYDKNRASIAVTESGQPLEHREDSKVASFFIRALHTVARVGLHMSASGCLPDSRQQYGCAESCSLGQSRWPKEVRVDVALWSWSSAWLTPAAHERIHVFDSLETPSVGFRVFVRDEFFAAPRRRWCRTMDLDPAGQ